MTYRGETAKYRPRRDVGVSPDQSGLVEDLQPMLGVHEGGQTIQVRVG